MAQGVLLKLLYWCNQITHSDKDYQILFMGVPNMHTLQQDAVCFEDLGGPKEAPIRIRYSQTLPAKYCIVGIPHNIAIYCNMHGLQRCNRLKALTSV